MALVAKRVVMVLYSCHSDPYSHQVRVVLAEKGVNVDIQTYNKEDLPEKLLDINPYNSLPTLVDRELVLYHAPIIMEYLDERFPHPSLLPIYPVARAESRKMLFRIEHDWYRLMKFIESSDDEELVN
ncbi:MAG: glutathione S-transferase N-terminal domain-containing protein, partial [Legionellales bacterium]|nr:glutathione S-transferase N-terminal domain-containing protein [Legionellales bacterium]